jgi:hypothetical protein
VGGGIKAFILGECFRKMIKIIRNENNCQKRSQYINQNNTGFSAALRLLSYYLQKVIDFISIYYNYIIKIFQQEDGLYLK